MNQKTTSAENIPASDELQIISNMIEKTKAQTADSGIFLIMWGWLIFAACILTYIFVYADLSQLAWLPWAILMPIGGIVSAFWDIKSRRYSKVRTYTSNSIASLWQSCGIGFFIIGFLAIPMGMLSNEGLVPVISVITGIAFFATGGIIEWTFLRWCGVIWWVSAIASMFFHWHFHAMILALTILPGYLLPGYILRRDYKIINDKI